MVFVVNFFYVNKTHHRLFLEVLLCKLKTLGNISSKRYLRMKTISNETINNDTISSSSSRDISFSLHARQSSTP